MDFAPTLVREAIQEMARGVAADDFNPHAAKRDESKHFPVIVNMQSANLDLAGIYAREEVGGSSLGCLDAGLNFKTQSEGPLRQLPMAPFTIMRVIVARDMLKVYQA